MCAKPEREPLTGEVLGPESFSAEAEAILFVCAACGRCVMGESVLVAEGGLYCTGCDMTE